VTAVIHGPLTQITTKWPVWAMIARSDTNAMAAAMASPERIECPAYFSASDPPARAHRFTIKATDWSVSLLSATLP
jgi:hypothetical protein